MSPSLETLVKNLSENAFKLLSQEFDNKILDLVKRKGFYPYEYMSNFVKFYEHLKFGGRFRMKTVNDYYDLYVKYDLL